MTSVLCVYVSWYTHWVNIYISSVCVKSYKTISINKLTNHTITYEIWPKEIFFLSFFKVQNDNYENVVGSTKKGRGEKKIWMVGMKKDKKRGI